MIPVAYQGWCINVYCMYAYCLCITNIVTVMIEERKRVQGLTCWAPVIALNRARSFNSFPYILEWTTSLYIFLIMLIFFYEVTTGSNTVVTGSNRVTSRPWPKQLSCFCYNAYCQFSQQACTNFMQTYQPVSLY